MEYFVIFLNFVLFIVSTDADDLQWDYKGMSEIKLRLSNIKARDQIPARFTLYTRLNRDVGQAIATDDNKALKDSNYNEDNPTRFIIHGWNSNAESISNILMRSVYLDKGDFNIFSVDWSKGMKSMSYVAAYKNVEAAGTYLANFILFLTKAHHLSLNTTYLIGHNLGAHVAGIAGKQLNKQNVIVEAIIGLDPALPLFSIINLESRLNAGDAGYVQIIHTSGSQFGFQRPIGDADYYPNWGRFQPACSYDETGRCSTGIAAQYFSLTLQSDNQFLAKQCSHYQNIRNEICEGISFENGFVKMGGDPVDVKLKGVYYLPVDDRYPFALGEFKEDD